MTFECAAQERPRTASIGAGSMDTAAGEDEKTTILESRMKIQWMQLIRDFGCVEPKAIEARVPKIVVAKAVRSCMGDLQPFLCRSSVFALRLGTAATAW